MLTDEQLVEWERDFSDGPTGDDADYLSAMFRRADALIAEVRRLRAIVDSAEGACESESGVCSGIRKLGDGASPTPAGSTSADLPPRRP